MQGWGGVRQRLSEISARPKGSGLRGQNKGECCRRRERGRRLQKPLGAKSWGSGGRHKLSDGNRALTRRNEGMDRKRRLRGRSTAGRRPHRAARHPGTVAFAGMATGHERPVHLLAGDYSGREQREAGAGGRQRGSAKAAHLRFRPAGGRHKGRGKQKSGNKKTDEFGNSALHDSTIVPGYLHTSSKTPWRRRDCATAKGFTRRNLRGRSCDRGRFRRALPASRWTG